MSTPSYNLDPAGMALFEACKSRGSKIYHYKGSYTLVTYDWFTDVDGIVWTVCFRQESCDMTYAHADGAFIAINRDRKNVNPDHVVFENFFKSNQMLIFSLDRLLEKNSQGKPKFVLEKKDISFQPTIIDHLTPVMGVTEAVSKGSLFDLMK